MRVMRYLYLFDNFSFKYKKHVGNSGRSLFSAPVNLEKSAFYQLKKLTNIRNVRVNNNNYNETLMEQFGIFIIPLLSSHIVLLCTNV
jgi:hypothetical protein